MTETMVKDQRFRIANSATEIEYLAVDHVQGHDVIFWEEIEIVFPGVKHVKRGQVVLSMLQDANGCSYDPPRIKYHPNEILNVEFSTDVEDTTRDHNRTVPAHTSTNSQILISTADQTESTEGRLATLPQENTENIQSQINSLAAAIEHAKQSEQQLTKKQLISLIHSKLSSTLPARSGFEQTVTRELGAIAHRGSTTQQIVSNVLELQKRMNDRLELIQKKTEAILTQQVELADESSIPRLFVVLPEKLTEYDPANWFTTKFRIHFICECGEHSQPAGSNVIHHPHLAKHEGYLVRNPTTFFKKFGPFLMLMLELIKASSSIASIVVPALAILPVMELFNCAQQSIETVTAKIDYSLECIENEMEKLQSSSLGKLGDAHHHPLTNQDLANYLSDVEDLQGVKFRRLESTLNTSKEGNLFGNLYRMTTEDGHIKWVCHDHCRTGYQEAHTQKLRDIIKLAKGMFDEQLGTVHLTLRSSFAATEFFDALAKAKGALELIVGFNWNFTSIDIELLRDSIMKSTVAILHVDLDRFQPSPHNTQLLSISSRYERLYRLLEPVNLRLVHLVLPMDIKPSNFIPERPLHLQRLTFESVVYFAHGMGQPVRVLSEMLKDNSITTSWYYSFVELGGKGAQALSATLQNNSALTTLDMTKSSIGQNGLQVLSEALKNNSTLTSLDMRDNSIGERGAQMLSEALKTNSTLTTLNMGSNSIGDKGVQVFSEALKINSTLTTLDMRDNSIGERGAQALSEALKTNSTLTTLDMRGNMAGEKGMQALFEVLKTNATLITLIIRDNSIREKGAQTLSDALMNNSTLTTLDMGYNLIGDDGAQALSEALKTNSTLTSLDIRDNLVGDRGTQALSKALSTNSTLTTLNLGYNSIGDIGALALSEALRTNSALTSLELGGNQIRDRGTWALSDALNNSSTLATLGVWNNSIRDKRAPHSSKELNDLKARRLGLL